MNEKGIEVKIYNKVVKTGTEINDEHNMIVNFRGAILPDQHSKYR